MMPVELLAFLSQRGVHLWPEGACLRYRDPKGALTPALIEDLRLHKPAILAMLKQTTQLASPPRSLDHAHQRYREAIADVARIWDGLHDAGDIPPWLPGEDQLDDAIDACFKIGDADGAIRGIEAWRKAWLDHLAAHAGQGPRQMPVPAAEAARGMDARIHQRAQALIDESEGRRPHPNQAVHDAFDRDAAKGCRGHRHWRSIAGVVICGVCHPPAHPGLVVEWLEEGGDVTR